MEIQQARYFVALCETLNFTRAAERSNVTQPSLTRAIKLLEDELGGALFNRERNRTHLTELGRLVEPHIREVMAQAQTARTRATAFFQLKTARLKLGITHGVPLSPLQETLQHYAMTYPDTEIEIFDDRLAPLQEALRRGDFEVVVLPLQAADIDDLHYYPLGENRLHLVVPIGDPLAELETVPLVEIATRPLVCGAACQLWEMAERQLGELGHEVRPRIVAGSVDWMHELVAAGVGVGLSPHTRNLPAGLVSRPVEQPAVSRTLSLATKRGRLYSPPVKAFIDLALRPTLRQPPSVAPNS
jgi:LysR family hydrogen peroxide-inducible transcriptional activator